MKNVLIIYAHPYDKSFNKAVLDRAVEGITKSGNKVEVSDLYAMKFNPVMNARELALHMKSGKPPEDIAAEQKKILKADAVFFIFPLWWGGMPAILKGYIDRVFSYGFAYNYNDKGPVGLLSGKKAAIITTTGATEEMAEKTNMHELVSSMLVGNIMSFCGLETTVMKFLSAPALADEKGRKAMLEEVKKTASALFSPL